MLLKEGKKILISIPFLIYVIVMAVAYQSQYSSANHEELAQPQPEQEQYLEYGSIDTGDTEMIMQGAVAKLIAEYSNNSYSSYPFGFYKEVRLNDNERDEMGEILTAMTGYTPEQIIETAFKIPYVTVDEESGNTVMVVPDTGEDIPIVSDRISYQEFQKLMDQAAELIGGGSSYSSEQLEALGRRPLNYEEAEAVYQQLKAGGYSEGYARLLCDYMCIFAGLFPAFISVAVWLRDRSAKMRDIIWTRKTSSIRLTFARYGAIILLCSVVVLVIAGIAALGLARLYPGDVSGISEFFILMIIWVIPSIMTSAAVGAFFTELTDTPLGILFMLGYWFMNLSITSLTMGGLNWFTFIPRHNTQFLADQFNEKYLLFLTNRFIFTAVSILLMLITALVLERKRRGRWLRLEKIGIHHRKES